MRRGHDVTLQTWERWRAPVEAEGIAFTPAPEYSAFPIGDHPLDFYEAVVYATRDTLPWCANCSRTSWSHDILTLGPSLAGELLGIPRATLIPHVFPDGGTRLSDLLFRCAPAPHRTGARLLGRGHTCLFVAACRAGV